MSISLNLGGSGAPLSGLAQAYSRPWSEAATRRNELQRRQALIQQARQAQQEESGRSLGGLLGNFGSDLVDFAIGGFMAPFLIPKASISTAWDAIEFAGGNRNAFSENRDGLDDMISGAARQYKEFYVDPFLENDGGEAWKSLGANLYEHPLQPVLDVIGVASLGAGTAASVAGRAVRAGTAGQRASSLAGYERVPFGPLTREDSVSARPTQIGSVTRRRRRVKSASGKWVDVGEVAQNPVIRARQQAYDSLSSLFPTLGRVGADARAARRGNQRLRNRRLREAQSTGASAFAAYANSGQARRAMKSDPLVALEVDNTLRGVTPARRAEQLERDTILARGGDAAEYKRRLDIVGQIARQVAARQNLLGDPEAATVVKFLNDEKIGLELDRQARARKETRSTQPSEARQREAMQRKAIAARMEEVGIRQVVDEAYQDYKLVSEADYRVPLMEREATRQRQLEAQPLTGRSRRVANRLIELSRPTLDATTDLLVEGGVTPRADVALIPQRITGDTGGAPVKVPSFEQPASLGGSPSAAQLKRAPKPSSAKYDTGLSYRSATRMLDPKAIQLAYQDAARWVDGKRRLDEIKATGRVLVDGERPRQNEVVIDNAKLQRYADQVSTFLEEARIAFGDSVQLTEAAESMWSGFAERFKPGTRYAVPRRVERAMMSEIDNSARAMDEWLKGYDKIIGAWRTGALTIRPGYYINNFLGQTMLLLTTHGMWRTLRNAWTLATDKDTRSTVDRRAGAVTGGSQMKVMNEDTAALLMGRPLGEAVLTRVAARMRSVNDVLSTVGRMVTDDPFRRIAFLTEVRGPARRLQRERPDLSLADAIEAVLSDERFYARVEEKVLGDLIDFNDLTPGERAVARRIAPFYSWFKGSTKRYARMMIDEPLKLAINNALYSSVEDDVEEAVGGAVPEFLGRALPAGEVRDGVLNVVPTAGFNPGQTPADVIGMVRALGGDRVPAGAENPVGYMSPLIQVGVESLTGRDTFTGDQLPTEGSFAGRLAASLAGSLPQVSSFNQFQAKMSDPGYNSNALYRASLRSEVLKQLGVPIREANVDTALRIGDAPRPRTGSFEEIAPGDRGGTVGPGGTLYWYQNSGLTPEEFEAQQRAGGQGG